MKFPIRIRQEENGLVLDAVPAFAILLNYRILDTVRGTSVEEVKQKTHQLLSTTLHQFMLEDEFVGLPRMLSIYQESDLKQVEQNKIWETVEIELPDLELPTQTIAMQVPSVLAEKLNTMAQSIDSTPEMMLTMLLAHIRSEVPKSSS